MGGEWVCGMDSGMDSGMDGGMDGGMCGRVCGKGNSVCPSRTPYTRKVLSLSYITKQPVHQATFKSPFAHNYSPNSGGLPLFSKFGWVAVCHQIRMGNKIHHRSAMQVFMSCKRLWNLNLSGFINHNYLRTRSQDGYCCTSYTVRMSPLTLKRML